MLRQYWDGNFMMFGREDHEIISTLEHYQSRGAPVNMPNEEFPISDLERLEMFHILPCAMLRDEDWVYFKPMEDVGVDVNTNAIMHLRNQAKFHEKLLRGGLYKIDPGRDLSRYPPLEKMKDPTFGCYYFLSKDIMDAMAHYDWDGLIGKYVEKGQERERILKHPNIGLNNTLRNNAIQERKNWIRNN